MIDSHSHIYCREFNDDRDQVIARACEAGVRHIIMPNENLESVQYVVAARDAYPGYMSIALGLHPEDVDGDFESQLAAMRPLLDEYNPVAVGDNVEIEVKDDGTAFIRSILPRRNYIIRRASNLSREFQILAANLDMAVLVVTLVNPETSTVFIDRFLATAEAYNVPVTIVFNKIDLLTEPEDRELLDAVIYLYRSIGYTVVPMSVMTSEGLDLLRDAAQVETVTRQG